MTPISAAAVRTMSLVEPPTDDELDKKGSASADKHSQLVDAVVEGRLRLHQLPDELSGREKAEVRRRAVERQTGTN
ncbi:MAG: hypothetical protein AAGF23_25680, partial [Acidobacteriota bacterium]